MIPGIRLIGPGAFLEASNTLIIADLHLGAEGVFIGKGALLPRTQQQETLKTLQGMLDRCRPQRIIIAGDLKHEFGTIHDDEWRSVLEVLDFLQQVAPVTVIKGNHDTLLVPILRKRHIVAEDAALVDGWLVCHGDRLPPARLFEKATGLIIGHEHPSLLLDDGVRKEKFKCFLYGSFEKKKLLVLPSMYPLVEGSDVLRERGLGPIFREAKEMDAYVVEGFDVLPFGRLAAIERLFT